MPELQGHDEPVSLRSQGQPKVGREPVKTEVEPPKEEKKGPSLEERLNGLTQAQAEQAIMVRLQGDPDYRAVMDAKQKGRKIAVVPEEQLNSKVEEEEPKDLDTLTNSQLLSVMEKRISKSIQGSLGPVLQPIQEKLGMLEGSLQGQVADKVKTVIEQAQAKYPDFDEHRADMALLNQRAPGLNVDELYRLVKTNKGQTVTPPSARQTSSERPTSQSARPPQKAEVERERKVGKLGRKGFSDLLTESLAGRTISMVPDDDE